MLNLKFHPLCLNISNMRNTSNRIRTHFALLETYIKYSFLSISIVLLNLFFNKFTSSNKDTLDRSFKIE